MTRTRKMDLIWLTACAFQMGLLSGCGGAMGSGAAGISAGNLGAVPSANAADTVPMPVRIKLVTLTKPLSSNLQIQTNVDSPNQLASDAKWVEEPTTLPPPDPTQGTVLADFRDYQGCVVTPQSAQLCFRVQPDVDSVAANAEQMNLQGIENLVPASCRAAASHLALQRADHVGNNGLVVHYTASEGGCKLDLQWSVTPTSA